jgi:mycothiol synthase
VSSGGRPSVRRVGLVRVQRISDDERTDVESLAAAAEAVDGVGPLDDQVRLELAYGAGPDSHHILGRLPGHRTVIGYAHAVRDSAGVSGHLVVHPEHRQHGVGRAVVDHLLSLLRGRESVRVAALGRFPVRHSTLRLWAHGNTPGAQALAAARGLYPVRELRQMRHSLRKPVPAPTYDDDVTIRTFEPGRDDEDWVALNAIAFATHPEQGRLTLADLRHRMAQPWFDPAGFFLAERDGALVGSHWTKIHAARETASAPVGEVYAIGLHPKAQGLGLGKALTLAGLQYLRDKGLEEVMLYVDGDNTAAVGMYERLGFTTSRVDVMYGSR